MFGAEMLPLPAWWLSWRRCRASGRFMIAQWFSRRQHAPELCHSSDLASPPRHVTLQRQRGIRAMTIKLPEDLERFIRAEVQSGHFASEEDAIAEAVRLLKRQLS